MNAQLQPKSLEGEFQLNAAMRMIARLLLVVGGAVYFAAPNCGEGAWITCHFFTTHDVFMIGLLGLALLALSLRTPGKAWAFTMDRAGPLWVALLCGAVFVCGALGRDLLLGGFDLSRDEVMAVFDGQAFRAGRLFSSLPLEWRELQEALQPLFMAPIGGGEHVISAYMPIHAALRALFSFLADPRFLNPLLAAKTNKVITTPVLPLFTNQAIINRSKALM